MDPIVGWRRVPAPDLDAIGSDAILVQRLRDEIAHGGAITFARFMEVALYDPDHGYYRGVDARPGRAGDFLTAPEAHPIFGHAVARQLDDAWGRLGRPDRFVVREFGAGGGALAAAMLAGLRVDGSGLAEAIRYRPVEVDRRRLSALHDRLASGGLVGALEDDDGRPIVGAIVANEVLDALPVHRLAVIDGRLRELLVGWSDEAFVDVPAEPSTRDLAARLHAEGIALAEGQRAEVCLALDGWIAGAARGLERGLLLVVDYGYAAADLYDPVRRRDGTLRAYVRHTVHDDPYRHVGRQDLTAHVDLTAVDRAAAAAGLDRLGVTTQAEFLASLGAGDLLVALQSGPDATIAAYLEARSALARMLDPAAMGRFAVLCYGRGIAAEPPLRGLTVRVARDVGR
jgi:SAM-dependent MidA family methyltransferase